MKTNSATLLGMMFFLLITGIALQASHYIKPSPAYLSYLSSTQASSHFCNGKKMDSQGYQKTITKLHITKIPLKKLSHEQQLNTIAGFIIKLMRGPNLAAGYKGKYITLKGTTAFIKPTDGWAGVSIYLCAYKPLLHVNLLRYYFVKKIVWQ